MAGCVESDSADPVSLAVAPAPRPELPLFAVRVPWDVPFEEVFPEGSGFSRELTVEEVATVVEELREVDRSGAAAERFARDRAIHVLALIEPPNDELFRRLGLETHPVPTTWERRLLPVPDAEEADRSPGEGEGSERADGVGLAMEALSDPPPSGVPPVSCTSTPAVNTFCPYSTTVSATRSTISCTQSLSQQLTSGETTYPPITVGGIVRDYYRLVNLGPTTGPLSEIVYGVRVGRAPDATVPVVRQLVVVGGQHSNEWEAIEMVRRLVFYFASQYQAGNPTIRSLLDQQGILFIPSANPEGYQSTHAAGRAWRWNRQLCTPGTGGIDPNRNFPFTFGIDNVGSSPDCGSSTYRGTSAGQAAETGILRSATTASGYRTAILLNTHTRGGQVVLSAGYSPGTVTVGSICTDVSNCTNPDVGLFYRLAGTERAPVLRHPAATAVPFVTDQSLRVSYSANGTLDQDGEFGSLLGSAPNFIAMTVELSSPCGASMYEERTPPAVLTQQETDLRTLVQRQLTYLQSLVGGTANAFELPLFQRRNVTPSVAAEPPTLRVAVRNGISGVAITNLASVAGSTSADDVRPGAFYTEYRWRPSGSPWVFPSRSFVCASGQSCLIATLDAPTNVASLNLCDPGRFTAGSGWTWTGDLAGNTADDCNWTLTQPGVINTAATLTSTARDLTHMSQSRLVLSFFRKAGRVGLDPPIANFDVEVSSNGFVGCSMSNYGACRIVRRVGGGEHAATPPAYFVTVVADTSDFDGQSNVRMRVRVWENQDDVCGDEECRGSETVGNCPSDCPEALPRVPRLRVYDPVFVGWYQ